MGAKNTKIDNILYYYVFQRKIKNYLNYYNKRKDKFRLKDGYIISPDWIKEWKMRINYDKLVADYLDYFNLDSTKLNEEQEMMINQFLENDVNLNLETKTIVKYSYCISLLECILIIIDEEITETFLENFINKKTFEKLEINDTRTFEKVKYIFKEKMFMLFIEKYLTIKILLFSLKYRNENFNLINFTLTFYEINDYENTSCFFETSKSDKIMNYFNSLSIFEIDCFEKKINNRLIYRIKNENYKEILKRITTQQILQSQGDQDQPPEKPVDDNENNKIKDKKIKEPKEINFLYIRNSLFYPNCIVLI